jgi:flagellar basal body-associated protein FliL
MKLIINNIIQFYYQGFKSMTVGRKLWTIIIVKLIILFLVLKIFFFPNFLKTHFKTDADRSNYVIEQLTK